MYCMIEEGGELIPSRAGGGGLLERDAKVHVSNDERVVVEAVGMMMIVCVCDDSIYVCFRAIYNYYV